MANNKLRITNPCFGLGDLRRDLSGLLKVVKMAESFGLGLHPDGGEIKKRLEVQLGDLAASCQIIVEKNQLDVERIGERAESKQALIKKRDQASPDQRFYIRD